MTVKRLNVADYRSAASRRLPKFVWDYVEGGAEDERTCTDNLEGFAGLSFEPDVLVDVDSVDLSTNLLGTHLRTPVLIAPTGLARLVNSAGDLALARAADAAGTVMVVSSAASHSLEEIRSVSSGALWLQIYLWRDTAVVERLLDLGHAVGVDALCLTVDVPVVGRRERDIRNGLGLPPRATPRMLVDGLVHPRWGLDFLRPPKLAFANLDEGFDGRSSTRSMAARVNGLLDPTATWERIAWLRRRWDGPIVCKGVMSARSAERAIAAGFDGVIVSNHGGRQLDGLPATIRVLPEIAEVVDGRIPILLDGGIRRGRDIAMGLALGAQACLVGRPVLYGLAVGGAPAVTEVLELLTDEFGRTMRLLGAPAVGALLPEMVRPRDECGSAQARRT